AKFQTSLMELFSHHGWGLMKFDLTKHDQGLILVSTADPIFAALLPAEEKPTQPVDSLMAGILGGFFADIFQQDLDCVQTKCRALGHDASVFVIGLSNRLAGVPAWQEAGKSHEQILKELANLRV
ncbi:MAG: V4R domain-containing protein, partial [Gemmataceae bacterium]